MDDKTLEVLGATAEVMGVQLSDPALDMMAEDLAEYPADKIRTALKRLRQESGRFTVAEIIKRLPGMWPTAEIAWATAPRDEEQTFVTTREALIAWDVASQQDAVSGRMSFKESYDQRVSEAKGRGQSPEWIVSLGHDKELRENVVLDAVSQGLLAPSKARAYLPHIPVEEIEQFAGGNMTAHALLESHQPAITSLAQLVTSPDTSEAPVASVEEAKVHLAQIMGILNVKPKNDRVQTDLAGLKRLHRG